MGRDLLDGFGTRLMLDATACDGCDLLLQWSSVLHRIVTADVVQQWEEQPSLNSSAREVYIFNVKHPLKFWTYDSVEALRYRQMLDPFFRTLFTSGAFFARDLSFARRDTGHVRFTRYLQLLHLFSSTYEKQFLAFVYEDLYKRVISFIEGWGKRRYRKLRTVLSDSLFDRLSSSDFAPDRDAKRLFVHYYVNFATQRGLVLASDSEESPIDPLMFDHFSFEVRMPWDHLSMVMPFLATSAYVWGGLSRQRISFPVQVYSVADWAYLLKLGSGPLPYNPFAEAWAEAVFAGYLVFPLYDLWAKTTDFLWRTRWYDISFKHNPVGDARSGFVERLSGRLYDLYPWAKRVGLIRGISGGH